MNSLNFLFPKSRRCKQIFGSEIIGSLKLAVHNEHNYGTIITSYKLIQKSETGLEISGTKDNSLNILLLKRCLTQIFGPENIGSLELAVRNERNYRSNYHLGQAHYHAKRSNVAGIAG